MVFTVRPQLMSDVDAVRHVLTDAFADDGHVASLAETLLEGPSRIALVAESEGEVVGSVQLSRSWLDADKQLVDVLVLSPIGVARSHQHAGAGSLLVEQAVTAAETRGAPLVWLEGDPRFYSRLGFERADELGFRAPSARIPAPALQVRRLAAWEPWMTGGLVYPDAFWLMDSVGLRD